MADGLESDQRKWIPSREAVLLCRRLFGMAEHLAQRRLGQFAADRIVATRCTNWARHSELEDPDIRKDADVPPSFWSDMQGHSLEIEWNQGLFATRTHMMNGMTITRIHGALFCETDIREHHARITGQVAPTFRELPTARVPRPTIDLSLLAPVESPLDDALGAELQKEIGALRAQAFGTKAGDVTKREAAPQAALRPRANPVKPSEITAWYKTLTAAEKTLGVTNLWALARKRFPGRHLPRKMVEHYGAGRGTGHRSKAQSSPKG